LLIRGEAAGSIGFNIFEVDGAFATGGLRPAAQLSRRSSLFRETLTVAECMPSETALRNFIASAFRSVWALDLVQILHGEPEREFTHSELIEILRASDLVIRQSVGSLMAAGLVITDDDNRVRLHSQDRDSEKLLVASIELYRRSPDMVRRLIVAQSLPGATAFADAFRLRKD
jgi:hypothetical protein